MLNTLATGIEDYSNIWQNGKDTKLWKKTFQNFKRAKEHLGKAAQLWAFLAFQINIFFIIFYDFFIFMKCTA